MSSHDELTKQFREQQQKYAYYIIALCVAGIGFSVQKTIGVSLQVSQIPLAVAVFCWGISIYCGLNFLGIQIAGLYKNSELLNVIEGRSKLSGTHPEKIQIGIEVLTNIIEQDSKAAMAKAVWQNRLFYLGIIAFIIWRIWEMSETIPPKAI